MLTLVERKYFFEIGLTCRRLGWKVCDETRHAIGRWALGEFRSHKLFTAGDYDRIFKKMVELRNPLNISAVMDVLAFVNHDVAQARHVPVVRPGKPRRSQQPPRRRPSQYERMTAVDDSGERKRLVYVIGRLFTPPLIDQVFCDRWRHLWDRNRDWREMPLPELTELRDLLKARLSKFITKVKTGRIRHDFGFSLFNPNTGRDFSNAAIIALLLRRGEPVDMRERQNDQHDNLETHDLDCICEDCLRLHQHAEVPF